MKEKNLKFNVTGMSCAVCAAHVEKAVSKVQRVHGVNVNLLTNSMSVVCEDSSNIGSEIVNAVKEAGYGASESETKTEEASDQESEVHREISHMRRRLVVSFIFMIPLLYLAMGHMWGWPLPALFLGMKNGMNFAFTQFLLCLPILLVNEKYFRVGFKTLWKRSPNMDALIAIGSTAAVLYGVYAIYKIGWGLGHGDMALVHTYTMDLYFETAAMILTLVTLGKY
ncbi:MAG: cation transporter, partial [Anaerovorax sp.]